MAGQSWEITADIARVADNDLVLGQIVDAVSHSCFWTNTCLFAVEDDPQAGWNHVSGFRTTAYVTSPFTRRHAVVSTQFNQTSRLRIMELILGLPPMNQMDATATPMFDCFTNTPDFAAYEAMTNNVPLDQMNPAPESNRRHATAQGRPRLRPPAARKGRPVPGGFVQPHSLARDDGHAQAASGMGRENCG